MISQEEQRLERNNKFFGAIGAVVEWYDLMLYGYLSTVLAVVFFPEDIGSGVALTATLGGFAIGFLARPVGGVFFGWLGDRAGRKTSLTLSITMMSIPMVGTAVLPSYAAIGWLAPVLLIFFRLVGGFSSGGEYSGTLVFLTEGARTGRRGRTVAIATMYAGVGILLAALAAGIVGALTTQEQMQTWGWRIPYVLGSLVIVVGIYMRRKMQEPTQYQRLRDEGRISAHPIRDAITRDWLVMIKVALLTGYGGITYFIVLTYLVSYLKDTAGVDQDLTYWIGTMSAAIYALTAIWFGALADKIGRKPPMWSAALALIVLPVPMFYLLTTGNIWLIAIANLVLLVPVMAWVGAVAVASSELLPVSHRNSAMGISYNVGSAVIGSTAPLIAQLLIGITGSALVPAWYLVVASVLILPVIRSLPETAFRKLT